MLKFYIGCIENSCVQRLLMIYEKLHIQRCNLLAVQSVVVFDVRFSCFSGDVVLKDLKLKAEALNSLKLPVAVKSGFVGTITLKVAIFLQNFDDFPPDPIPVLYA